MTTRTLVLGLMLFLGSAACLASFSGSALAQEQDALAQFVGGARTKYSTEGHSKAKGMNVSFEYPSSWSAVEGERPNVIQRMFPSPTNGIGTACLAMVMDVPQEAASFSATEIANTLASAESLRETLPSNVSLLSNRTTKYDGQPGVWVTYAMEQERAGLTLAAFTLQQMVVYNGKVFSLQCSVGGSSDDGENIRVAFSEKAPLFQQMGNTIIIPDAWKQPK